MVNNNTGGLVKEMLDEDYTAQRHVMWTYPSPLVMYSVAPED